jgi:hypothetical protein
MPFTGLDDVHIDEFTSAVTVRQMYTREIAGEVYQQTWTTIGL